MKKKVLAITLACSSISSPFLAAQVSQSVAPIALQLSLRPHDATRGDDVLVLRVTITNVSNHVYYQSFCKAIEYMYELEVRFNGEPLAESAEHRKERLSRETYGCKNRQRELDPGQSRSDNLYYKASAAGTYEFTAVQDIDLADSNRSEKVKSNSLMIPIPDPTNPPQRQ